MDNEEGQKWPPLRRLHPNSTAGAPNGQSRFMVPGKRKINHWVLQTVPQPTHDKQALVLVKCGDAEHPCTGGEVITLAKAFRPVFTSVLAYA